MTMTMIINENENSNNNEGDVKDSGGRERRLLSCNGRVTVKPKWLTIDWRGAPGMSGRHKGGVG